MKALFPLAAFSALALAACSQPAPAPLDGGWVLDGEASRVNFVSVKAGMVAEAHSFAGLSGSVSADGAAQVDIDLASVQTNVDIRDERMKEVLFDVANFPAATISANVDPAAFASLAVGQSFTQDIALTLDLRGNAVELPATLAITRIGEDRVSVETANPIIVSAASVGLEEGLEQLRELANLDSFTGQVPVSASLTFEREGAGE